MPVGVSKKVSRPLAIIEQRWISQFIKMYPIITEQLFWGGNSCSVSYGMTIFRFEKLLHITIYILQIGKKNMIY